MLCLIKKHAILMLHSDFQDLIMKPAGFAYGIAPNTVFFRTICVWSINFASHSSQVWTFGKKLIGILFDLGTMNTDHLGPSLPRGDTSAPDDANDLSMSKNVRINLNVCRLTDNLKYKPSVISEMYRALERLQDLP